MSQFQDLIAYFEDSSIADSIRENDMLFPSIESIHVVAICLVVGSILVLDMRLLGFASVNRPVGRLTRSILPLTWTAFVIAASSGFLLFISHATKYLGNGYFLAKMGLLVAAGLNMIVFHAITGKDMTAWEKQSVPPSRARVAGALSVLFWVAIVACGRWIGFTIDEVQ